MESNPLLKDRYQMVSFPLLPEKNTVEVLFKSLGEADKSRWRLFGYESEFKEMWQEDSIQPGRAYWLHAREITQLRLDSQKIETPAVSRPFAVPLAPRWNCISNPFYFDVSASALHFTGGENAPYVYEYTNGDWLTRDSIKGLKPWTGYIVWNGKTDAPLSDSLFISPLAYTPSLSKVTSVNPGVELGIRVISRSHSDGLLHVGFGDSREGEGMDRRDNPKPEIVPKPLKTCLQVSWDPGECHLSDYRGKLESGGIWQLRAANDSKEEFRFQFTGLKGLGGSRAVLLHKASGKVIWLNSGQSEYTPEQKKELSYELAIGSPEYIEGVVESFKNMFSRFFLKQNTPNPFIKTTAISYSVPAAGGKEFKVELRIYSVKGVLKRSLVSTRQKPGPYTINWDGRDAQGRRLKAGTYVYRLRAGDKYDARKMMVLLR